MSLKAFIKSKNFLLHIVLIIVFFGVLVYLTLLLLKGYTHHGESLAVPSFAGLNESEVAQQAAEKKLRYQIIDSVYVAEAIPGTVISQFPEEDAVVKERRMIYLTVSAIAPERVMVPVVVDVSFREAQSRLENAGLSLGKVEYRPSEFFNLVLDKSVNGKALPDDTLLIKGTAVDLVVGKGLSNEKTLVPDLKAMSLNQARDALYNVSLNIGALMFDESVYSYDDSLAARVWKQDPESIPEDYIELGTSVDLWLTIDEAKLEINLQPDSLEMNF